MCHLFDLAYKDALKWWSMSLWFYTFIVVTSAMMKQNISSWQINDMLNTAISSHIICCPLWSFQCVPVYKWKQTSDHLGSGPRIIFTLLVQRRNGNVQFLHSRATSLWIWVKKLTFPLFCVFPLFAPADYCGSPGWSSTGNLTFFFLLLVHNNSVNKPVGTCVWC